METEKFLGLIEANLKEGTDLAPIKEALGTMNQVDGIKDKDQAWSFIKQNDLLLSTLDQKVTERVQSAKENLLKGEVADMIKAREAEIRAEINPEETPEQKEMRELKGMILDRDNKESLRELQDKLSLKAKELNFDPMDARDFAIYGENAEAKLTAYSDKMNKTVEDRVNEIAKGKFSNTPPKASVTQSGLPGLSDTELNRLAVEQPEMKAAVLEEARRRSKRP